MHPPHRLRNNVEMSFLDVDNPSSSPLNKKKRGKEKKYKKTRLLTLGGTKMIIYINRG
jgi:hypothetical protein